MEIYVPNFQLKEVSEVLTGEGVSFEVTDKTFSLSLAGKETYEVTAVKAELLESDMPAILDVDSPESSEPSGCLQAKKSSSRMQMAILIAWLNRLLDGHGSPEYRFCRITSLQCKIILRSRGRPGPRLGLAWKIHNPASHQ